jgi:ATP-dependent Clp protease ATP-binding subunit ClpA
MFERFVEESRRAVVHAQEEAVTLGHGYIGTEHLLLGVVAVAPELLRGSGVTREAVLAHLQAAAGPWRAIDAEALATIGIDLDEVRRRIEDTFGPDALLRTRAGCRAFSRPFTRRAKKVLELALHQARRRGDGCIGPEHILLGLVEERDGVAARILGEHGVTLAALS